MKMRTKLAAISGLAAILTASILINPKPSLKRPPTARPAYESFQAQELPYTIPGTNRADPEYIKNSGLPEGNYIVKPHPYNKEGSFLIVKDTEPLFHSTTPVLSNPNGSFDAYRPLRQGENLDDVTRECPVDRFVPPIEKLTLDASNLEPGDYLTFIQRNDVCDSVLNSDGTVAGDFTVKTTSKSFSKNPSRVTGLNKALKSSRYELYLTGINGESKLGTVYLNKDDIVKVYKYK